MMTKKDIEALPALGLILVGFVLFVGGLVFIAGWEGVALVVGGLLFILGVSAL